MNAAKVPEYTADPLDNATNPAHDPNPAPVPWVTVTVMYPASPFVVAASVAYSLTDDANEPDDVTATHRDPDDPGFRLLNANSADPASSSARVTDPTDKLFPVFDTFELNAPYDA